LEVWLTAVFLVIKSRVDMARFSDLVDPGGDHSRPLLQRQVYIS
jgi:hypothetical protein